MKIILGILLYLVSYQVFGQRDIKVSVGDFNKDKVVDTLKTYYEGGSGFGGKYVQVTNGKTNEVHKLTNFGCYCDIKSTILIPPELNKTENQLFLETIKKQLLPKKRSIPDPSLDWVIKSSFSNIKPDNDSFFDLIIDPKVKWKNNKFEYPETYYIDIKGDTLTQLHDASYKESSKLFNKKGFLVYFAHNHYKNNAGDSLKLSDSNSVYKIFNTSHGVVVKKEGFYKWLFISDFPITGAPEKLRWESIKKTKLLGNYLIVLQDLPPDNIHKLFVINIETGICGRLKYDFSNSRGIIDNEGIASLIEWKSVTLDIEGKQFKYELEDIFKELETQYNKK